MVAAIDDGQPDAGVAQGAGRIETAESTADDDDMGNRHGKATDVLHGTTARGHATDYTDNPVS